MSMIGQLKLGRKKAGKSALLACSVPLRLNVPRFHGGRLQTGGPWFRFENSHLPLPTHSLNLAVLIDTPAIRNGRNALKIKHGGQF
jgi:hypothetical protein